MIETRMKQVMGEVLGVPPEAVAEESSAETLTAWDSMHHMSLILALEQEFGVTFADRELPDLTTFGALRAALGRLGAAACS
jgi:acyl carrier protein